MKIQIRKIDPFVGELLYDHDCVIITDLGGFVASYRPASVNPALHVLTPASKRIAFNGSLRHNDGLLANHIAHRTGMTYPEACDTIRDYVNEAFRHLETGKRVNIEKVGVLFMDAHKNLQFTPDNNANFLIDSFGLSPVHTPVIRRDQPEEEQRAAVVKPFKVPSRTSGKRKAGILEMIPAAAVLAILFITPPALQRFNTEMSGMLPFSRIIEVMNDVKGKEKPAQVQFTAPVMPNLFLVPKKTAGSSTAQPVAADTTRVIKETPVLQTEPSVKETSSVLPLNGLTASFDTKEFHVIGGCFRLEANAQKFAEDMRQKGYDAKAIGKSPSGLYMVSLFQSGNRDQASAKLEALQQNGVGAGWIWSAE